MSENRELDFSIHLKKHIKIFISRQNKLVCSQRASKKFTRFVPLRFHLLEIRRRDSWNTLPRQRSGIFSSSSFFPHDICLYIFSENAVHIGGFYFMRLRAACYYETEKSAGFPPFVRLNFVVECKVNYCEVRIEVLDFVSWRKIVVIPNVMR